jgi:hypothetical protein
MKSLHSLLFAIMLLTAACSSAARPSANCETVRPDQSAPAVPIGATWSGVYVDIGSAVSKDGVLVTAFYDAERYLTLATYDPDDGRICRKRLPSRFGGWDAHNTLVVAVDAQNRVHVAGNMHASPLVYAAGPLDDLDAVTLSPMIGRNEDSATYPHFLHDRAGNLMFLYRDGMSGNGLWLLNIWRHGRWERLGPLFSSRDAKGPVSAYPSAFVKDRSGRFHVAIVWRRTPDVATNFALTYASTRDFQQWDVGGKTVTGPLAPAMMEVVDAPGEQQGLVNNAQLALSPSGKPVILFTKYAADGHNAVFAATKSGNDWLLRNIVAGQSRAVVSGGGSMPGLPVFRFADTVRRDQTLHVSAVLGQKQSELLLDADRLTVSPWRSQGGSGSGQVRAASPNFPKSLGLAPPSGMDKAAPRSTAVRQNGIDGPVKGQLRWFAQQINQDQPHACKPTAPLACKPPPSPLIWLPADGG